MTAVENNMYMVIVHATQSYDVLKLFTMIGNAGANTYMSSAIIKTPSISTTITKYGDPQMLFLIPIVTFSVILYPFSFFFQQTLARAGKPGLTFTGRILLPYRRWGTCLLFPVYWS